MGDSLGDALYDIFETGIFIVGAVIAILLILCLLPLLAVVYPILRKRNYQWDKLAEIFEGIHRLIIVVFAVIVGLVAALLGGALKYSLSVIERLLYIVLFGVGGFLILIVVALSWGFSSLKRNQVPTI